ncbi:L-seryl-tRNA(Sec) selenium transferase [Steroidobacter agaridevorans]|uniref:L-seryl-tRNA(Sec) selenium transferase n=1 Tax=Steroidobacter agaridevorans TaxID=2695856 RepID=A0A829YD33_9GAMM|nr:L-seryl-tRNA(Sec) selenium transferase [Steroidobacter agaridevorans]GFE80546.1 L-seryl-tRNA(Sec) selenium transferase [Steroidobacter agaridevorans]GFE87601.1 L-seryl-tRNA(Sec) selenium transferase [Steroidobacter agaridevorans]
MATQPTRPFPSVDRIAHFAAVESLCETYGRSAVIDAIRAVLDAHRERVSEPGYLSPSDNELSLQIADRLQQRATPRLRRVFNLTGTVLHTNLGRTQLSSRAIEHASMAMREACNLEFDLDTGGRGERDSLVEDILIELTGAEAATVVNNNAAAVLLVLATVAHKREVVLSRGELVEIGGAFRIPDVMRSANTRLIEVGTTNRTHPADYERAIGPKTAALMKVHMSNYKISGFVAHVSELRVARIAHEHQLPLIVDLGAGSLIDLAAYGLPKEPVVRETIASGADVVTFSGDKLLGGPQAGLIVGKKALIDRIKRHPLKRALRVSKPVLAALEGTLLAYRTPDLLLQELPTLRLLTRPLSDIEALADRLLPLVSAALGAQWQVNVTPVSSQVGSGSLPVEIIPSMALTCRPTSAKVGSALKHLATEFRRLPVPVIGRIANDALVLDLRCLEDEHAFIAQLERLAAKGSS